ALKFGFFSLPGNRISPYFVDLGLLMGFPDLYKAIIKLMSDKISVAIGRESFTRVCGISLGSIPLATGVALDLAKPLLCLRRTMTRGRYAGILEGPIFSGDRVLIVDDVCATGLSIIKAKESIISDGGIVEDAFVILDREEGGGKRLHNEGIRLTSITTITEVVDSLLDMGHISAYQHEAVLKMVSK
ncbi:MAG: phosphoribosyltransferase family protein, partial [Thermoproteota archaeon]